MARTRSVVITTINPPTSAVIAWARTGAAHVIVVGDRKTPDAWECEGTTYLSLVEQLDVFGRFAERLPIDHYSRKNLGYLAAMHSRSSEILDTDDDNFPESSMRFPFESAIARAVGPQLGFVNPYAFFTHQLIWPRGHPIDLIPREEHSPATQGAEANNVVVWQSLVDEDPDVDSLYRLVIGEPCTFAAGTPLILGPGTVAPFNSQSTLFLREAFPLLYLPSLVSFRFSDILRGLVAQPILWAMGLELGFCTAGFRQERNVHDLVDDFTSEVPMFLHTRRAYAAVEQSVAGDSSAEENLVRAYSALVNEGIVPEGELELLDLWIGEVSTA